MAGSTRRIGTPQTPKTSKSTLSTKVSDKLLSNVNFDDATQKFLNASYGSEAAWYNDPEIGPVLKAALNAGKNGTALTGTLYQDFIRTHKVDPATGSLIVVNPNESWFGTHGASVRLAFGQKKSDIGTYNQNVSNVLNDTVIPAANTLGVKLDQATLQKIAEDSYTNGWTTVNQINSAILAQKEFIPGKAATISSGAIGKTNADFSKIANEYGITLPNDPTQLDAFIKGAVGPGGDETAFTEWCKQQAIKAYPFLKDPITAGSTVSGYFGNYATNIANTLGIPASSINWSQPKWQSLVNPIGATEAPNLNDVLYKVKTDPQYGYDKSPTAINDAYDLAAKIKGIFGQGSGMM